MKTKGTINKQSYALCQNQEQNAMYKLIGVVHKKHQGT